MKKLPKALRSWGLIPCLAALASCGSVKPTPLQVTTPNEIVLRQAPRAFSVEDPKWSDSEKKQLREALEETSKVIESSGFQRRIVSIGAFYDGPDQAEIDGSTFLSLYLEKRLAVTYVKGHWGSAASTGIHSNKATTTLKTVHIERWPKGDSRAELLRKACLVNTIAHEWTHAIAGPYDGYRIVDADHAQFGHPLVSYTVGSVAHCAFLENKGLLVENAFWQCVEDVGTNIFNGAIVCESEEGLKRVLVK